MKSGRIKMEVKDYISLYYKKTEMNWLNKPNVSADNLNWSFNFRKEFNLPLYFQVEAYNTYYLVKRKYNQGFIGTIPWKETVYLPCRHNSRIILFEDAYTEDKIIL